MRSEVFAGVRFGSMQVVNIFRSTKSYVAVIRTKEWKLIEETIVDENDNSSKNIELYDIVNDKEELHNLKDEKQDVLRSLQKSLNMWLRKTRK